ncbi:MAG TPA: hypothetical protein VG796_19810 [Verrucomicrobiales bacterium]|jgi:hypothetical protein|nr:hypothetical protein [Verrucomicrobiales bacterium]
MPSFPASNKLYGLSLNGAAEKEILEKIGQKALREVEDLLHAVYLAPGSQGGDLAEKHLWHWTYAPSLVVRGEMEVFGQSHPRFALRVRPFAGHKDGFLNLRRVQETCDRLPPEWTPITSEDEKEIEKLGLNPGARLPEKADRPGTVYKESSAVADCLLPTPANLDHSYFILKSPEELALAFGEGAEGGLVEGQATLPDYPNATGFRGSPYMRQIQMLGAGVCAQAVCFMASALLARHARYIHGLAEITTRARSRPHDPYRIRWGVAAWHVTGGLNSAEISKYFKSNGLKTHLPGFTSLLPLTGPRLGTLARKWKARTSTVQAAVALRRYILAGVPVILNVDLNRMCRHDPATIRRLGLPAVPVHNIPSPQASGPIRQAKHAVLVIGCAYDDPGAFVIHDPAVHPFVTLSVEQWDRVCHYDPKSVGREVREGELPKLETASLLPVLPHDAICWWLTAGSTKDAVRSGLQENEEELRRQAQEDENTGPFAPETMEWQRHRELSAERDSLVEKTRKKNLNLLELLSDLHQPALGGDPWMNGAKGVMGNFLSVQDQNPQCFYPPETDVLNHDFQLVLSAERDLEKHVRHLAAEAKLPANPLLEMVQCLKTVTNGRARATPWWFWISCLPVDGAQKEEDRQQGGRHQIYVWDACARTEANLLLLFGEGDANHWDFFKCLNRLSRENLSIGAQHVALYRLTANRSLPVQSHQRQSQQQQQQQQRSPMLMAPPELALITSCVVVSHQERNSLASVMEEARKAGATCADVYCFMHQQVQRLFKLPNDPRPAIDILAAAYDGGNGLPDANMLAEKLAQDFADMPVRAFSTYLPEACATAGGRNEDARAGSHLQQTLASKAIAFLLLTAEALGRHTTRDGRPHEVKVLELVCGTRLRQVRPVRDRRPAHEGVSFVTSEWGTDQALQSLLQTLLDARERAKFRSEQKGGPQVTFALELEPGDYYTLNGQKSVERLLELLDNEYKVLQSNTGLNLDVPHWGFLCDEPAMAAFAARPDIIQRIVHMHLSDHFRGHFCDLPAGYFRAWNDHAWRPWMALLPDLMDGEKQKKRVSDGLPCFSGVVSCELEAARSMSQVVRAVKAAGMLVRPPAATTHSSTGIFC